MDLNLRLDEARLLLRILTSYLSDLRMEISNTDSFDLRQTLKREEETIKSVIHRLEQGGAAASQSS